MLVMKRCRASMRETHFCDEMIRDLAIAPNANRSYVS